METGRFPSGIICPRNDDFKEKDPRGITSRARGVQGGDLTWLRTEAGEATESWGAAEMLPKPPTFLAKVQIAGSRAEKDTALSILTLI